MAAYGPSGAPYTGPREIHYLFVDGGALRGRLKNVSKKFFSDVQLDIQFANLAQNFTKVFYYDALPVREPSESEDDYEARVQPSRALFEAASSADRVHVYEGDARRRKRRGLEQKKVDVMLTVDMLTHSFRKNMHQATLLTGDNDFKPLIDALVQDGMFVTLWFPPGETSKELIHAADARRQLDMPTLRMLLTPESQALFRLPQAEYVGRSLDELGVALSTWYTGTETYGLYRLGMEFFAARAAGQQQRFQVRHDDYELLRAYCLELGVKMPDSPPAS